MKIYKAYKLRLYPNIEQTILINKSIGSSRFIYNMFLDKKETCYKETKINLSLKTMKHMLVELKQEENYKWLNEVDSMSLTNTLENLDTAYTNYFEKRGNKPVFKKKGVHESYTTNCIRSAYKNNNNDDFSEIQNDNVIKDNIDNNEKSDNLITWIICGLSILVIIVILFLGKQIRE